MSNPGQIQVDSIAGYQDPQTVVAPQPPAADNSQRIATTSFVQNLIQKQAVDFVYDHSTSYAQLWVVPHNLNRFPNIAISSVTGVEVEADVVWVSPNLITITFAIPFAGFAYLA